jgi:hypothetical protein
MNFVASGGNGDGTAKRLVGFPPQHVVGKYNS